MNVYGEKGAKWRRRKRKESRRSLSQPTEGKKIKGPCCTLWNLSRLVQKNSALISPGIVEMHGGILVLRNREEVWRYIDSS